MGVIQRYLKNQIDISPTPNATIHHIDRTLADRYYRSYYEIPFMEFPEEEQQNILINGDILTEYEDHFVPTIGGMLIFGKDVSRKIPQSELILAIFIGMCNLGRLNFCHIIRWCVKLSG